MQIENLHLNIGLGKDQLIRNLSLQNRLLQKGLIEKGGLNSKKSLNKPKVVVIIEYIENNYWMNKPALISKEIQVTHLKKIKSLNINEH